MSDDTGTFEHADHVEPRRGEGYCTDDMARLLVAVAREPRPGRVAAELGRTAFRFIADAQGVTGTVRNRRAAGGRWSGRRGVEDCWGRTVWAFGTAVRRAPEEWMRQSAKSYFGRGVAAALPVAAGDGLRRARRGRGARPSTPRHDRARSLLADAVTTIGPIGADAAWPWPEARLTYANAVLPDALLAAGHLLDRPELVEDGLTMLRFLLDRETVDGHLSPTAVGGAGPGDVAPSFDQQPIEVAAMADACARAEAVTGDTSWRRGIELAAGWFLGANDADAVMWDPETGGGYDGLHADGANLNEGTESTLALITTLQQAWALEPVPA